MIKRRTVLSVGATLVAALLSQAVPAAVKVPPYPLVDSHSHLVSNDRTRYPQAPATAATSTAALPGLGFKQFGTGHPVPEADAIIGWMNTERVETLVAVQKRGAYGLDNSYILDSSDAHPDRFVPVVVLDSEDPKTAGVVRDLAARRGLGGVRITGVMAPDGGFPWLVSPAALATWQAASDTGVVVDIMTQPFGHPEKALAVYADLAARFPKVRIVLDHLGWPPVAGAPDYGIDASYRALAAHKNIYYKFTTMNMDKLQDGGMATAPFLKHAVQVFGADHVMWGSDTGNTPGSYREMVQRALDSTALLTARERRLVLRETARKVFVRGGLRAR